MNVYFIVNQRRDWPYDLPGATVVTARDYLSDAAYAAAGPARIFNLCRTDRYQGRGYYVSLVAEARGHQPAPSVKTIEDLQAGIGTALFTATGRVTEWTIDADPAQPFELDAYFGRDPATRNDAAARQVCDLLRAPLVRARFEHRGGEWRWTSAILLTPRDIPRELRRFAAQAAADEIAPARPRIAPTPRPALAILHNADAPDPPSDPAALERFLRVARAIGMHAEIISRHDIERLPQFDALFIRDTTWPNHYTYQFARRAVAEGLVVIDDPDSILKSTNKVFLGEILARHQIPVPRTLIVDRDGVEQIVATLGFPCIVKKPDGAFSNGVARVDSRQALDSVLARYFEDSELVVAQEWLPTTFDWRVGVLDGRPLYVCKYLMAPGHWQVIKREHDRKVEGATVAMAVGEAPEIVIDTAVRAANLIGRGLYGVDLKQVDDRCYVIEVNDNPNIDAGNEDAILGDALYREVLGVFLRRARERGRLAAD
ncbi:MAG TPA: RimK family protein [Casimicrobiaceae bacterium]|nr:RimK family protein [Casimicrobiaceae bacterium]